MPNKNNLINPHHAELIQQHPFGICFHQPYPLHYPHGNTYTFAYPKKAVAGTLDANDLRDSPIRTPNLLYRSLQTDLQDGVSRETPFQIDARQARRTAAGDASATDAATTAMRAEIFMFFFSPIERMTVRYTNESIKNFQSTRDGKESRLALSSESTQV
jgi:hypothetical protein